MADTAAAHLDARAGTVMVVLAGIGFGTVPFFARSLIEGGMTPYGAALWRFLIPALVFLPLVWRARHHGAVLVWAIGTGYLMGLGWTGYVRALDVVPVATVSVVYMTYPAFTVLFGALWLRQAPAPRALFAAGLVLAAAALAIGPARLGPGQGAALLLSLTAPASFAFGIVVLVEKLTVLSPLTRIGAVSLGSVLGLLPLVMGGSAEGVLPGSMDMALLAIGIALVTALIPQLIFVFYAPVVGAARAATAGSVELPTMILMGWLAFGEAAGWAQWAGCALILLAIALTPGPARRGLPSAAARGPTRR